MPNLLLDISVSVSPRRTVRELKVGCWSDNQEHFLGAAKIPQIEKLKIEKANKNWKLKTKKMKNLKIESWLVGQSGTISWRRKKRPQNEKLKKQIEIGN